MSVMDEIRKLDEQKAALLSQAKQDALDRANAAIAELNELGFSYRLTGNADSSAPRASTGSGTRRTGIRDQVLQVVQGSEGMKAGDIIEAMGARGDKSATQSISNALSALKKAGTITQEGNLYKAS